MSARQLLADALGVPVRRVRRACLIDRYVIRTGAVSWSYDPRWGRLIAETRTRRRVEVETSRAVRLPEAVRLCRAGLAAMGVRVPTIILSRDGATLYALRAGAPEAIGYATATHVCVYEPVGADSVKHRREHYGDPRAVLVAELGRYWPGEVVG